MIVAIKGMDMPLSCGYCPLKQFTVGIGDDCLVGAKKLCTSKDHMIAHLLKCKHRKLAKLKEITYDRKTSNSIFYSRSFTNISIMEHLYEYEKVI